MPKLITVQRPEQITRQAQDYVKTYILIPSGLVGLVSMLGGVAGLGYQLFATDLYTWQTFLQSTGLIVFGVALGFAQSRYHFYLLQAFPDVLAARIRSATKKGKKSVKEGEPPQLAHPGKQFVSAAYLLGTGVVLGASWLAISRGQVMIVPAVLLPWAGFYWARLFFWRGRV
ncbi:MAG: hypothetical protein ABL970_06145 [Nitrospira sp.]